MTRDELYMKKALELAEIAAEQGEVPVGAIVVKRSSGEIIGRGFNRREYGRSPLTHAELVAIEEASRNLGGWRLMGCELFVTLEPCPMCTGAIINSRIERVVFGAYDKKAGSCGSVVNLFELPYNHRPLCTGGILQELTDRLFDEYRTFFYVLFLFTPAVFSISRHYIFPLLFL